MAIAVCHLRGFRVFQATQSPCGRLGQCSLWRYGVVVLPFGGNSGVDAERRTKRSRTRGLSILESTGVSSFSRFGELSRSLGCSSSAERPGFGLPVIIRQSPICAVTHFRGRRSCPARLCFNSAAYSIVGGVGRTQHTKPSCTPVARHRPVGACSRPTSAVCIAGVTKQLGQRRDRSIGFFL